MKYFDIPFAQSGDKTVVPDPAQSSGSISYNQGYTSAYALPNTSPGYLNPDRQTLNQVLNDITLNLQQWQVYSYPTWFSAATYSVGAIVQYTDGNYYASTVNSNTATPGSSSSWLQCFPNTQITLQGNITLYVATTGSDSNNGLTSGTPFLTIQKAINTCYQYNLNGYTITINVANGTYTGTCQVESAFIGAGATGGVVLNGNTSSPTNCVLQVTGNCLLAYNAGSVISIQGFKLISSTNGLYATRKGQINVIGIMEYSTCATYHIVADDGGSIYISAGYAISGSSQAHYGLNDAGANIVIANSLTVTLSGTPNFTAFVTVSGASTLNARGITFSGSATGQRFSINQNAVINTGTSGNLTYFPGNTAGAYTQGSQYDQLNSNMAVGTGLLIANNLSDLASRTGALATLGFGDVYGISGVQIPDASGVNWRIIKGSFTTSGGGPTTLTLPQSYTNSGTWDIVLTSNNSGANIANMNTYNKTANTVQVSAAGSGGVYVGITADYIAFGY